MKILAIVEKKRILNKMSLTVSQRRNVFYLILQLRLDRYISSLSIISNKRDPAGQEFTKKWLSIIVKCNALHKKSICHHYPAFSNLRVATQWLGDSVSYSIQLPYMTHHAVTTMVPHPTCTPGNFKINSHTLSQVLLLFRHEAPPSSQVRRTVAHNNSRKNVHMKLTWHYKWKTRTKHDDSTAANSLNTEAKPSELSLCESKRKTVLNLGVNKSQLQHTALVHQWFHYEAYGKILNPNNSGLAIARTLRVFSCAVVQINDTGLI